MQIVVLSRLNGYRKRSEGVLERRVKRTEIAPPVFNTARIVNVSRPIIPRISNMRSPSQKFINLQSTAYMSRGKTEMLAFS